MSDERDDDLIEQMNNGPHPEVEKPPFDLELMNRRLALTPAQRVQNYFKAKELADRMLKRIRDKYFLDWRLR